MRIWSLALLLACVTATGQPLALPAPPAASLQQRPGAMLPLDTAVRDDLGQSAQLADYFRPGRPVLLVLGYYRCPQLCGLLMHGLLEALHATQLPVTDWRIVGLSIDPQDTPEDARRRRELDLAYARFLQPARDAGATPRIDLLVAQPAAIMRIAQGAGFTYAAQPVDGGYAHPATVMVLTPSGQVSRYFNGVDFDATQLRGALVDAGGGAIGGLGERLAILCAHFNPAVGTHSAGVMNAARAMGLLTLAGLAVLAWRHDRKRKSP
jgi:protein SCO1